MPERREPEPGWPFDQAPDAIAITLQSILDGAPILYVSHDEDDHSWQFLDGTEPRVEDGRVICMADALALDETVHEIADLPPGWIAWRRDARSPWRRGPHP
jgi:hypothetical protein